MTSSTITPTTTTTTADDPSPPPPPPADASTSSPAQPEQPPPPPSSPRPTLTLAHNLLYALAACITVANVYWYQAILPQLGTSFSVDSGTIGLVGTVTQIGYACGLLFICPLGDMIRRRTVVLVLCVLLTGATVALPFVRWLWLFKTLSFFIGLVSVTPQIMIPLVADLSPDARRGKAVGMIVSGLMLGILGSRVISGLVARYQQWEVVYYLAAALNASVTVVLFFFLPAIPCRQRIGYPRLMGSLWQILRDEVVLQQCSMVILLVFAVFQLFWTDLTFHLHDTFGYDSLEVGLFGFVGMAGICAAPIAGHIGDRSGPYIVTVLGLVLLTVSLVIMSIWGPFLAAIIVGGFVLDLSFQMVQVSNQIRIYALNPSARSRITSVYMVSAFLGGSMGSAAGSSVYDSHGWVIALVMGLAWVALAVLVLAARTPLQRGIVPGWCRGGKWWKGLDVGKEVGSGTEMAKRQGSAGTVGEDGGAVPNGDGLVKHDVLDTQDADLQSIRVDGASTATSERHDTT
ncbi:hypothetical protein HKX48_002582 [Thoreauomyces humboldtii]|nr:hypothetical protein HKX48_002582 [Thoreauomyces humboldtii]